MRSADTPPIIDVKALNVVYFPGKSNEVHALTDISLEIYPGEFIIFFGPSGCGKSTLLYSISGLEHNITGDILIKGDNLRTLQGQPRETFHQKTIGMVFQAYYLIPSLSVLQNVTLPQTALNVPTSERDTRGQKLLEQFGVGQQAHKLPNELSGGQQQRVAICRSVMNDPDIILADEPVGNLDSKSSEEVMMLLRQLNDVEKKTVVLVTHDPSHLHNAHRVFFIRDGHLVRTQENTEADRKQAPVAAGAGHSALRSDLEAWAKTLGPDAFDGEGAVAGLEQAHSLLTGLFTELSAEDMTRLEGLVKDLIAGQTTTEQLFKLLHDPASGFSFSKTKAERLTKRISSLAEEVKKLKSPSPAASGELRVFDPLFLRAREISHFVLKDRHPQLKDHWQLLAIDQLLFERLSGRLDAETFRKTLAHSQHTGGAELSTSSAQTLARKAEELIRLGGDRPAVSPLPETAPAEPKPESAPAPETSASSPDPKP